MFRLVGWMGETNQGPGRVTLPTPDWASIICFIILFGTVIFSFKKSIVSIYEPVYKSRRTCG